MKHAALFILFTGWGALGADLTAVQQASQNFSRLQALIDQHRSIQLKGADGQMSGSIPLPAAVSAQASQISSKAETFGCSLAVVEQPPTAIQFGSQTMSVAPFTISYNGQACPIHLNAAMTVAEIANQPNSFDVKTNIVFSVDADQVAQFGFQTATITQDATVNVVVSQATTSLSMSITSSMDCDGGTQGKIHGDQGLSFNFSFSPPLNLNATSQDFDTFVIAGVSTTLTRKQTLVGLSPSAQYFINNVATDRQTFETTLQGLQFFGINETPAAKVGLLSCTGNFITSQGLSSADLSSFQSSGKLPAAAPAFSWSTCGSSDTKQFGAYGITEQVDPNWLLMTIQGAQGSPLNIYFLYDENSYFVRTLDQYSVLFSCSSVTQCPGGTP